MHEYTTSGDRLQEAYNLISSLNKEAYKDIFLLSNQVLSKNPFTNKFLDRFLSNKKIKPHSTYIIVNKLLKYYINSFRVFILYLLEFVWYFISGLKFRFTSENELILIDTYFLMDRIKESNSYSDPYFPGLEDLLIKMNKSYAYLPFFYGSVKSKKLYSVLKILRRDKIPVLTEYQLMTLIDIFYLFYFMILYPLHVFRFAKGLRMERDGIDLLKYELVDTIDQMTIHNFSRYLQGKRIARLPYNNIKVISWYENQVIHKNLYKGLRECGSKVRIYGAQLFLYGKMLISILADENEDAFGIVPDKIVVNGTFFMPEKSRLNYSVGPSLRYKKLFTITTNRAYPKDILVLLPYLIKEAKEVLRLLSEANINPQKILIKNHPATSIDIYKYLLSPDWKIEDEDIYTLFERAKIVIGAATGSLIEAASVGIPIIVVKTTEMLECIPKYGKGIIWDEINSTEELNCQVRKFEELLNSRPQKIKKIADDYKNMFFCEPTEKGIIEAFEL